MYLIEKRLLGRASIVLREYLTKKLNRKAEILLLKKEGGKKTSSCEFQEACVI